MKSRLTHVLFHYRLTPQTTTGVSPSELLLGRCPRSRLDLLKPHTAEQVEKKQSQQKQQHNARARKRKFEVGTDVFVRNYHQGDRWLPGVIEKRTGPVSFKVKLTDGRIRRCHQDQVRNRSVDLPQESHTESDVTVPATVPSSPTTTLPESPTADSGTSHERDTPSVDTPEISDTSVDNSYTGVTKTYPKRSRDPVERYEPTW